MANPVLFIKKISISVGHPLTTILLQPAPSVSVGAGGSGGGLDAESFLLQEKITIEREKKAKKKYCFMSLK